MKSGVVVITEKEARRIQESGEVERKLETIHKTQEYLQKKKRREKWVEEGSKDNLKNKRKRKFLENRGKKGLENILRNRNKEIIKKRSIRIKMRKNE